MTAPGTVTADPLARLRAIEQAATPPPWTLEMESCDCGGEDYPCGHGCYPYALRTPESHVTAPEGVPHRDGDYIHSEFAELTHEDMEFIAAARTMVPRLLAGYDALLGLARECEQKQLRLAEWRNRAQILGASVADMAVQSALASAYGEAAAKIRSAIAAALFAEESAS